MSKKGPVVKNTNKKNRHGTNCNDQSRVLVGKSPNDHIPYSLSVQKSVSHYIQQYDLKCSILQFPMRVPWHRLLSENELSNEFLDVFASRVNWSVACRYQKLSEELMNKYVHLLDWPMVSLYQKFSKKFISKHLGNLDIGVLINHRFLITQVELDELRKQEHDKQDFLKGGDEIEDRFEILDM